MQDRAGRILRNQLKLDKRCGGKLFSDVERRVFSTAYTHLTSRNPPICWTSGQWMTERTGGSDVRGTETLATFIGDSKQLDDTDTDGNPLGPWRIDGFKTFSSATDSHMTLLLAKEPSNEQISLLFAPTRRVNPRSGHVELNGIQLQRLKAKLGTHPLPTAELVLDDMRAWRIGMPGQRTKEISAILNITRIHTAMTGLGYWGRGLAIRRSFARVKKVAGGRRLRDMEAYVRMMAANEVNYRARMMLCFSAVSLMGRIEHPGSAGRTTSGGAANNVLQPQQEVATHLFRPLTPLAKVVCSKDCVAGLQECMESLGGVGFLENEDQEINIAQLFRDANVLPIREGTTEVLGSDVVRVLKQAPSSPTLKTAWRREDRFQSQGSQRPLDGRRKQHRRVHVKGSQRSRVQTT